MLLKSRTFSTETPDSLKTVLDIIHALPDTTPKNKALADILLKTIMATTKKSSPEESVQKPKEEKQKNATGDTKSPPDGYSIDLPHSKDQDDLDAEFERY